MVIRLDSKRLKDVVNHKTGPIGVDGDPTTNIRGLSEADRIVEEAQKTIASARLNDPVSAEKADQEVLHKMANRDEEPGPELSIGQPPSGLPSVDILNSTNTPRETH